MKKMTGRIVLAIAALVFAEIGAGAFTLGVGGTGWYTWWKPSFGSWMLEKDNPLAVPVRGSFSIEPNFFGGPVITMRFGEKATWTNAFGIGRFDSGSKMLKVSTQNTSLIVPQRVKSHVWRYDFDSNLAWSLTRYFSLFGGVKYQNYSFRKRGVFLMGPMAGGYNNDRIRCDLAGLGIGTGFNMHLVENLFLIINISGLYQAVIVDYVKGGFGYANQPIPFSGKWTTVNHAVGGNFVFSPAYYIAPASMTVAAGFRYQVLYFIERGSLRSQFIHGDRYDHFYGVTLTVIYTVDFPKKKEG